MAKLVFEMNQSLDGYVDHDRMAPEPLFQHWVKRTEELSATVYGRTMYGLMGYWDDDQEGWDEARRACAAAWRRLPKWVVSRTLTEVGPNATLVSGDVEATIAGLKAEREGEMTIAGPVLAGNLAASGLIDEYRLRPCSGMGGRSLPGRGRRCGLSRMSGLQATWSGSPMFRPNASNRSSLRLPRPGPTY